MLAGGGTLSETPHPVPDVLFDQEVWPGVLEEALDGLGKIPSTITAVSVCVNETWWGLAGLSVSLDEAIGHLLQGLGLLAGGADTDEDLHQLVGDVRAPRRTVFVTTCQLMDDLVIGNENIIFKLPHY